jgi:uncharacterized protein YjbI with pentapeptide repeats
LSNAVAPSELQRRWSASKVKKTVAALSKRRLSDSDFDCVEIDGRELIDLRGFAPSKMLLRLKAAHLDFSYSIFRPTCGLGFATLSHCLLRSVVYEGNIGEQFIDCDFSHSKLRRISALPGTVFTGCTFNGAEFFRSQFTGVTFTECRFTSARLQKAEFIDCCLEGCDFRNASFGKGSFGGSSLSRLECGLQWLDYQSGTPVVFPVPGSKEVIDLQDTYMGGVIINGSAVDVPGNEK